MVDQPSAVVKDKTTADIHIEVVEEHRATEEPKELPVPTSDGKITESRLEVLP